MVEGDEISKLVGKFLIYLEIQRGLSPHRRFQVLPPQPIFKLAARRAG